GAVAMTSRQHRILFLGFGLIFGIALTVSLVFVVRARDRSSWHAKSAQMAKNLRAIAQGMFVYASNEGGRLPLKIHGAISLSDARMSKDAMEMFIRPGNSVPEEVLKAPPEKVRE